MGLQLPAPCSASVLPSEPHLADEEEHACSKNTVECGLRVRQLHTLQQQHERSSNSSRTNISMQIGITVITISSNSSNLCFCLKGPSLMLLCGVPHHSAVCRIAQCTVASLHAPSSFAPCLHRVLPPLSSSIPSPAPSFLAHLHPHRSVPYPASRPTSPSPHPHRSLPLSHRPPFPLPSPAGT